MQTMEDSIKKAVDAGLVEATVAAEMMSSLSDDGKGPNGQQSAGAPASQPSAAPQPAAGEPRKSRSLF
jgi:hypothetical protein